MTTPVILSPSHVKFVYALPLLTFWHGLGQAGGLNLSVSVVGFSLPEHDESLRIALYQLVTNYQQVEWDFEGFGVMKDYARFVDLRTSAAEIAAYKGRYRFADESRAKDLFEGFGDEAVKFLFDQGRTRSP